LRLIRRLSNKDKISALPVNEYKNPETSEFSRMPSNAIATGVVDFILEPALMPDVIEDYVSHDGRLWENADEDQYIHAITDLIKETSPLDFCGYKQSTIF
jgi:two-component system CheB/CheR fusion protein